MKQYKSISLALLLSAPAFGMHQIPTPIKDSTDTAQTPEAFIGFHTFKDDEEAIPAIKVSEESILKEFAARTAHYDQVTTSTTEPAAQLTEVVEAGNLLEKTDGYESDTEKGLSKENIQLYRFIKYVNATTQTLTAAQPSLMAWFKNPEDDKTVEKLPELSKKLEAQTNRIEVWLNQINSFTATRSVAYSKLRNTIKGFEKSLSAEIGENQEQFKTRLVGDFSHPTTSFLRNFEALQDLVDKNS